LDNYDSFTYNLVHIIRFLGYGDRMDIIRNDKISVEEVAKYDKILLSPGPGIPDEAGIMKDVISKYASTKSILGICLGHQGIAEVFGAELLNMPTVLHGMEGQMKVEKASDYLFDEVPATFKACHYHSWSVVPSTIKGDIEVTAMDDKGQVMGIAHKTFDVRGLQFHPESVLTENGIRMIQNWLEH